jgi:hypothetical protein
MKGLLVCPSSDGTAAHTSTFLEQALRSRATFPSFEREMPNYLSQL